MDSKIISRNLKIFHVLILIARLKLNQSRNSTAQLNNTISSRGKRTFMKTLSTSLTGQSWKMMQLSKKTKSLTVLLSTSLTGQSWKMIRLSLKTKSLMILLLSSREWYTLFLVKDEQAKRKPW